MFTLEKPYVDQYGNTHNAAVVCVTHVTYNRGFQKTLQSQVVGGVLSYTESSGAERSELQFSAVLYRDQEALKDGYEPIPLRSTAYAHGFYIQNAPELTPAEYCTACEDWLKENIFNK